MKKTDIQDLLSVGERITVEYKKAEYSLPKSVWETYSSFANTIGGIIVLGISEDSTATEADKRFEILGVADALKLKKELFDTINSDKVNRNILTDKDVEMVDFEGKTLLCINVPQATYRQRPIFLNGNIIKGTYKRNHEGDYHCTEEEVKAMIRDANDTGNDGVLIEGYGMEDIDKPTLLAYRNRFNTLNPDHVWNELDDQEFLHQMGGYIFERNTKREGLTLAGLLMFGKGLAIRERFDNLRMDYLDLTNLAPDSRWSDRLTYDGRWENNLYNFFTRVLAKLLDNLKRPFSITQTVREDDTPVHRLVREALTNMVIHADYMIEGVLKVEKRGTHLRFANPGFLKLPIAAIYEGGNAVARNPKLQTMLRMIGMGDNIGSGFPTMLAACKKENWRKPMLVANAELRLVELTLSMTSLISTTTEKALIKLYGKAYQDCSQEEQYLLATALLEGYVANDTVQVLLDKNPLEAGKLLAAMVDKDLLLSTNKRRWTTYTLNEDYKSRSRSQGATEQKSRSRSQGVAAQKSRSKASQKKQTKWSQWQGANGTTIDIQGWSKQRVAITERLLSFCAQPQTLTAIAQELGYGDRYHMKKNYIDPLLSTALAMTAAEANDPAQKYVTIASCDTEV